MNDFTKSLAGTPLAFWAAFAIAGCGTESTAQRVSPAVATAAIARPLHAGDPLVYVSDRTNDIIDVFNSRGTLQYTITSGLHAPAGLFIDASHNLWVANPGADNVLEFARGAATPSQMLNDGNRPNDVAVCSNGTVFVADSENKGGVAVYPPGRTRPARRLLALYSGQSGLAFYVTCDTAGNVVATGYLGASPFIATAGWRHARQSGYYVLQQGAWSSSGIKATNGGNLLIATGKGSDGVVEEFTEAGKPTGREIGTGRNVWSDIALNAKESVVYGADTAAHAAVAYSFPGGALKNRYENANLLDPDGVAVDPGN